MRSVPTRRCCDLFPDSLQADETFYKGDILSVLKRSFFRWREPCPSAFAQAAAILRSSALSWPCDVSPHGTCGVHYPVLAFRGAGVAVAATRLPALALSSTAVTRGCRPDKSALVSRPLCRVEAAQQTPAPSHDLYRSASIFHRHVFSVVWPVIRLNEGLAGEGCAPPSASSSYPVEGGCVGRTYCAPRWHEAFGCTFPGLCRLSQYRDYRY